MTLGPSDCGVGLEADQGGEGRGLLAGQPLQLQKAPRMAMIPTPDLAAPRRGLRLLWLAFGLFLAGVAGAGWWIAAVRAIPLVRVETLQPGPISRVLAVNGQIEAEVSVALRSPVSGILQDILADEGDLVTAGTVLARIDSRQQEAILRQGESALQEGLVQQAQAAAALGRTRDLGANLPRSRLEDATRSLDAAAQEVSRLRALVEQAQIQLDRHSLRAPIDGTVIARSAEPGQFADTATPLFTLADLTRLMVRTDVDEAYATQILPGQSAGMQLVGTGQTLPGQVSFVSPRVNAQTGGLEVHLQFDTPQQAPVGLTVTVNILVEHRDPALSVPRTALTDGAVFVLRDGRARRVPVSVIDWPAARLIVTGGLSAGEQVIVDATGLIDGQAVRTDGP